MEYLVKSSSKILGPFTEEQVTKMIIDQQISLIDEIKKPLARWIYIRDEKKFLEVVQKIREEIEKLNEDTESPMFRRSQDLTPTPTPVMSSSRRQSMRDGAVSAAGNPMTNSSMKNLSDVKEKVSEKRRAQHTSLGHKVLVYSMVASAIALITLGISHQIRIPPSIESSFSFKDLKSRGLHRLALEKYKQLDGKEQLKPEVLSEMAGLLIAYEKKGPDLKSHLNQNLKLAQLPEQKARIENFMGIASLQEQKFEDARAFFQLAKSQDAYARPAEINLALLELSRRSYADAFPMFLKLLSGRQKFNEEQKRMIDVGFLYSFYHFFLPGDPSERKKNFKKYENQFERMFFELEKDYYLAFEKIFLLFFIKLNYDQENLDIYFDRLLLHFNHHLSTLKRSESLYWNWLEWPQLSKMCVLADNANLHASLVKTLCDLNNHRDEEAESKLRELILLNDQSISTLLTHSLFLGRIGRLEESKSQLELVLKSYPRNVFALTQRGLICMEKKDEVCALESFERLQEVQPNSMDAFIYFSKMPRGRARAEQLTKNLSVLDKQNYMPYIELPYRNVR